MNPAERTQAEYFLEVQLWAKENTPESSTFLITPYMGYGWRGFSERGSYGTFREWAHTSWLYTGDQEKFEEGQKRLGHWLGESPESLIDGDWTAIGAGYRRLRTAAYVVSQKQFYEKALELGQLGLVDYAVGGRNEEAGGSLPDNERLVFQSGEFSVYSVR